jgi:hypothetical protein
LPPAPGTPERRGQGHPVGPAFSRGSRPRARPVPRPLPALPASPRAGRADVTRVAPALRPLDGPGPETRRSPCRAPGAVAGGTPTRAPEGRRPVLPAPRAAQGGAPPACRRPGTPTGLALAGRRRLTGAPGGDRPWGALAFGPAPSPGGPWGTPRRSGPAAPQNAREASRRGPPTDRPGIDNGVSSYGAAAPASSPSRHRDGQCPGRGAGF